MKQKNASLKKNLLSLRVLAGLFVLLTLLLFAAHFFLIPLFQFKAEVQFVNSNGARIAYYTRGKGAPLVLFPGFGMNMSEWDPKLLENLSKHYELIVFDYRGVGDSTGDISNLKAKAMTNDVLNLLDALHVKKANVLGWSMGAMLAQQFVETYPQRVDHLLLISTGPGGSQMISASSQISQRVQQNLGGRWNDTFVPLLFPENSGRLAQQYVRRVASAIKNGEVPKEPEETVQTRIAEEQALTDPSFGDPMYSYLSRIKSPTLIIAGKDDVLIPVTNDRIVSQQIKGTKLVILLGAGHGVLFQEPDQVSQLVEEFMR